MKLHLSVIRTLLSTKIPGVPLFLGLILLSQASQAITVSFTTIGVGSGGSIGVTPITIPTVSPSGGAILTFPGGAKIQIYEASKKGNNYWFTFITQGLGGPIGSRMIISLGDFPVAVAGVTETGAGNLLSSIISGPSATVTMTAFGSPDYVLHVSTVPVPSAVWLFGSGLIGLIGIARKKSA